jgi:hypothetical protein
VGLPDALSQFLLGQKTTVTNGLRFGITETLKAGALRAIKGVREDTPVRIEGFGVFRASALSRLSNLTLCPLDLNGLFHDRIGDVPKTTCGTLGKLLRHRLSFVKVGASTTKNIENQSRRPTTTPPRTDCEFQLVPTRQGI